MTEEHTTGPANAWCNCAACCAGRRRQRRETRKAQRQTFRAHADAYLRASMFGAADEAAEVLASAWSAQVADAYVAPPTRWGQR